MQDDCGHLPDGGPGGRLLLRRHHLPNLPRHQSTMEVSGTRTLGFLVVEPQSEKKYKPLSSREVGSTTKNTLIFYMSFIF